MLLSKNAKHPTHLKIQTMKKECEDLKNVNAANVEQ